MIAAANSNRFDFYSATLPSRQRSDTSAANRNCRTPLMIVSKSQSQATLPEERSRRLTSARLAIASFIIRYLGWQVGHSGRLAQTATIRPLGCSRKMCPLAFLDPSAFIVTYG